MSEQLKNSHREDFAPVIFDEADTEFILKPVSEVGHHFKDQVSEVPVYTEGMKLEVTDEATAGFIHDCLVYRDDWLKRIITAHRRTVELNQKYSRQRLTVGQHENMRAFIAAANTKMEKRQRILQKLGFDPTTSE